MLRKIITAIMILTLSATVSYAQRGTNLVHSQQLAVSGTAVSSYALTTGTLVSTDSIDTRASNGYAALLIDVSGGSDDLDIYFQVSKDGTNWFYPYTTDGSSLTNASGVAVAVTADRWIDISSRVKIAPFIRFQFDPDANSTITATYLQQE